MKIEYKLKNNSIIYNIKNARAAYACADVLRVFFKDENEAAHDVKLKRKDIEYFFADREKRDNFITRHGDQKSIKDIIEAARRCRYNVKKCNVCPFYKVDNPDCYIDFMDAITYILGGVIENGK
jgi:hypothetical protein